MDAVASRSRLATLVLLLLSSACATTRPQPEQPKVVALEIRGTEQLAEGDIKDRIVTTATPWWEPLWPFDGGPSFFDPNAWQADLRRIERLYQAEGFYQAHIVSSEVDPRGEDKVALQATVEEGGPTVIGDIQVTGLEDLPPDQKGFTLEVVPLNVGSVFREADWELTKELVQGRMRELGYAEAEVGGEVRVDVATQKATVDLQLKPGIRYRFGNIFVATDANPQVPPKRISEQAQGAIQKGAWYSESALAEAQARVFRMGVFGAVKVNRGAPDREAGTVPVVVDVREAPFHSLRLGLGLGLESSRNEVRAVGEWTNRNFLGGLRRLTVRGRAGYAVLPNVFNRTTDGPIVDITTEFEQPRFISRDLRLQTSVTVERGLEQAYAYLGGRLRGGVIWQPHPDFSIFPSYNLEVYRLSGQAVAGEAVPPIVLGCTELSAASGPCNIALSYLEQVIVWDRRDDRIEPRDGFYAALALQEGGGPLQGDFTFLRFLPDLRYYRSFGDARRLTVAARLRLGTLIPLGTNKISSIVTRFFSGGPDMRGFNSRRLAPQTAISEDETVPVGGNGLFESSLEVRYRVTERFVLAAFWDTGFVTAQRFDFANLDYISSNLYHALGVGMRYLTVVGPVRLDLARRLNIGPPLPVLDAGTAGFVPPTNSCFGIGGTEPPPGMPPAPFAGSPEGLCTFHISIGEAF
ncbi:BamA/TamA family outer membrane protein [Myxococcaceae bacterium GXIMD 01537]